jgi:long-subunit acyl-CoA synthetase (AMP-forming)
MLGNRWEFIPTDLAAVSLGAVPFSIYQTYAPEQIQYLLSDAESKVVITEQAYLDNVSEARKGLPGSRMWSSSTGRGRPDARRADGVDPDFDPAGSVEEIGPDDLLTLIYTSGTTGPRRASSSPTGTCSSPWPPRTR